MTEKLAPLTGQQKRVLDLARPFEPPAGLEDQVFSRLQLSVAAGAVPPSPSLDPTGSAQAVGMVSRKVATVIAGAMLAGGLGGGVVLGRTAFAPAPMPPKIVERLVRVEVPVPAVPVAESPPVDSTKGPAGPKKGQARFFGEKVAEKASLTHAPAADELLARERELIDRAHSALLHGDGAAAMVALQKHLDEFSAGRLEEEREALWVQALVQTRSIGQAKTRAARFHEKFPASLLGPTVDATLTEP